jgi:hypothetical protein
MPYSKPPARREVEPVISESIELQLLKLCQVGSACTRARQAIFVTMPRGTSISSFI